MVETARRAGITARTLRAYEAGERQPGEETLQRLALVLGFPLGFFAGSEVELFPRSGRRGSDYTASAASFRSHYSLTASDRDSVLASGLLAKMIGDEMARRYTTPKHALPEFTLDTSSTLGPEEVAELVRAQWRLGQHPVPNMVHLLESKGVRVFWLARDVREVDALSFWREGVPYVVLNTAKSGERSRFDAAHELGHLLLHKAGNACGREAEDQANAFASAFLMPAQTFKRELPRVPILEYLLRLKGRWKVSVAAMVVRGHELGRFTDWQLRSALVELNRRDWRAGEPQALEHEESLIYAQIGELMARRGFGWDDVAQSLGLPAPEVRELIPLRLTREEQGVALEHPTKSVAAAPLDPQNPASGKVISLSVWKSKAVSAE